MVRLRLFLRREWLSLILAVVVVGLAANLIERPMGLKDLMTLRRDRTHLAAERAHLSQRNSALQTKVERLTSDDRYLEHLIRRELGYTRPDELVYKFADAPTD